MTVTATTEKGAARGDRWRAPSPARTYPVLTVVAAVVAAAAFVAAVATLLAIRSTVVKAGYGSAAVDGFLFVAGVGAAFLALPAARGLGRSRRAAVSNAAGDLIAARTLGAAAQEAAWCAAGWSVSVAVLSALGYFVVANNAAVAHTFFDLGLITSSFSLVAGAFWMNVYIFLVAEVAVLVWGLVIAIARTLPGEAGRPIRWLATVYTDVFRGLPAIITIYLVGFGLPLTGLPLIRDMPQAWYAILALTLTYGAYVAEVYRAGIDSIHQSQTAAARSLGLSYAQTLRYVVVPQAVRRIIPPLLNDFISLQKDTALVNVIGAIDAFNQAKIVASNHFNLSSVTTVAILFVVITIPQARFVDRLLEREQKRVRAG